MTGPAVNGAPGAAVLQIHGLWMARRRPSSSSFFHHSLAVDTHLGNYWDDLVICPTLAGYSGQATCPNDTELGMV